MRDLTEFRARLFQPKPQAHKEQSWKESLREWGRQQDEAAQREAAKVALEKQREQDRMMEAVLAKYPEFANWTPGKITAAQIQAHVCKYFGYTRTELLSHRRAYALVRARQIAMFLAKIMTGATYPEIGRRFEGRDHTTILHAVRKISVLIETDAALVADVNALRDLISPPPPVEDDGHLALEFMAAAE
jgi:chromosomal replication initiation ATPase DnaA